MTYLLAVISGIGTTHKVLIGPAIQVWVFPTNEAVSGVTGPAFTLVHRVIEVADVDAFGIFVTVVGLVLAWVLRLAHLKKKKSSWNCIMTFANDHIQHQRCWMWSAWEKRKMTLYALVILFFIWFPFCCQLLMTRPSQEFLFSHYSLHLSSFKLKATASWSEVFRERLWTKLKCGALVGLVDFMRGHQMHHTSHSTHCCPFIAAQGIHSCHSLPEDELKSSLELLHELIEQKVTAWTGLWLKLNANDETNPFSPNQLVIFGATYQWQAAAERQWADQSGMLSFSVPKGQLWEFSGKTKWSTSVFQSSNNTIYQEITCDTVENRRGLWVESGNTEIFSTSSWKVRIKTKFHIILLE